MAKLIKKADPRETNKIELGKDPYIDELYGCFRFDNPKTEPFATKGSGNYRVANRTCPYQCLKN